MMKRSEETAWSRAERLGREAAALGFDWPDAASAVKKVAEEVLEWAQAWEQGEPERARTLEFGDVLFSLWMVARKAGVDPAAALHGTCDKFERRFAFIKRGLASEGVALEAATLAQMDRWWDLAKARED